MATNLGERSRSVRAGASRAAVSARRARQSLTPPAMPRQIIGRDRNRLMIPPAATAPAPM